MLDKARHDGHPLGGLKLCSYSCDLWAKVWYSTFGYVRSCRDTVVCNVNYVTFWLMITFSL